MRLVELIRSEAGDGEKSLLLSATLAGLGNTLLLMIVNEVIKAPKHAGAAPLFLFAVAFMLYAYCARRTFHRTTDIIERALHQIKLRVVGKINRAELQGVERIGATEIYDRLTENVTILSSSATMIGTLLQSLAMVLFSALYFASLSIEGFGLLMVLWIAGIFLFVSRENAMTGYLAALAQTRLTFLDRLTDLVKGFRESRFGQKRSRELEGDIEQASRVLRDGTQRANHLSDENQVFANCILFALLGALAFFIPQYTTAESFPLSKMVAGVLFIWGPVGGIIFGFPFYVRSNHALSEIQALEDKLDAATQALQSEKHDPWQGRCRAVEGRDLCYEYSAAPGEAAFRIGPLNLSIAAGEIIFIVGGNGSGKSTFVKVLTGLYPPHSGILAVDGIPVEASNVAAYREMISPIYADFHLFSKLYGLLDVDPAEVKRLLAQMQLADKTDFANHSFTRRDLSTGQRKRLALIVALLEDRPIYVFDEWAADQDPEFRKYFYEELLPMLKQRGKIVIAVSHDDRYFRCADRVVTMEYGQILSVTAHPVDPAEPTTTVSSA